MVDVCFDVSQVRHEQGKQKGKGTSMNKDQGIVLYRKFYVLLPRMLERFATVCKERHEEGEVWVVLYAKRLSNKSSNHRNFDISTF